MFLVRRVSSGGPRALLDAIGLGAGPPPAYRQQVVRTGGSEMAPDVTLVLHELHCVQESEYGSEPYI